MAVLIPDMSLPSSCSDCVLCKRQKTQLFPQYLCSAMNQYTEDGIFGAIQSWCPLVEIKTTKSPMTNKELEECNFEL